MVVVLLVYGCLDSHFRVRIWGYGLGFAVRLLLDSSLGAPHDKFGLGFQGLGLRLQLRVCGFVFA